MYFTELGYDQYDKYLVGPEWKAIKKYFYENRDKYECTICGTHQQLVLHKRSYKFLSLPELKKKYKNDRTKIMRYLHTYMTYLCRPCNNRVHFYPSGERVPLEYRKLKDRELLVLRQAQRRGLQEVVAPVKGPVRLLGSCFKQIIKT